MRRVRPVEHANNSFTSALYSISFYREEMDSASLYEMFKVYPLLPNLSTPWFDNSLFYQKMLQESFKAQLNNDESTG